MNRDLAKQLVALRLTVPCQCLAGCERCLTGLTRYGQRLPGLEELLLILVDRMRSRYRGPLFPEGWHLDHTLSVLAEGRMAYPDETPAEGAARMLLECRR